MLIGLCDRQLGWPAHKKDNILVCYSPVNGSILHFLCAVRFFVYLSLYVSNISFLVFSVTFLV